MSARFILYLSLVLVFPSFAGGLPVIAGFGDSITCDSCNDGSYFRLLGDYLGYDPIIDDNGLSADNTYGVMDRLDVWLDGDTADVLVLLTGTPDVYDAANTTWVLGTTVANIETMIDWVHAELIPVILVAPPPVGDPCINPPSPLGCSDMNGRLAALATALSPVAATKGVPFVNLYEAFMNDPDWGIDPNLLFVDGVHPKITTGDDLIASLLAPMIEQALIPEPSTAILLASGLLALAHRRRRRAA